MFLLAGLQQQQQQPQQELHLPPVLQQQPVQQPVQPLPLLPWLEPGTDSPQQEEQGSAPLLCIKRTYQPHPRRWKRKHGFLKRCAACVALRCITCTPLVL